MDWVQDDFFDGSESTFIVYRSRSEQQHNKIHSKSTESRKPKKYYYSLSSNSLAHNFENIQRESRSLIKVLTRFLRNKRKFYDFEKIDIILIIDDCRHSISLPSPPATVAYHRHRVLELRCLILFAREKKVSTTTPNRARARETLINFRDEREIVKFIASISH